MSERAVTPINEGGDGSISRSSSQKRNAEGSPAETRKQTKKKPFGQNLAPDSKPVGRPKRGVPLNEWASSPTRSQTQTPPLATARGSIGSTPPQTEILFSYYTTPEASNTLPPVQKQPVTPVYKQTASSGQQHPFQSTPPALRPDQFSDIPSSPPVMHTSRGNTASPTPAPRRQAQHSQIPQLNYPQKSQRRPESTQDWFRRHAVDGVYSSPDRLAPPFGTDEENIPDIRDHPLAERIKFVNSCMKKAGFEHPSDYIVDLMTTDFRKAKSGPTGKGSNECDRLQYHHWYSGFETTLQRLEAYVHSRRTSDAWIAKLASYNRGIIGSATSVLNLEFLRFGTRNDTRRRKPGTNMKNKSQYQPAYLQLQASEVTPEFLSSNVVSDLTSQFRDNTPLLWHLLSTLTRNNNHNYRDLKIPNSQEKKEGDEHITTMALNMLYYSFSRSLRKMQTWFGLYLHATGVKTQVIDVFQQYGISIGNAGIGEVVRALADRQKDKLKQLGSDIINFPMDMVYDNINIHEKVAQQRGDRQDRQFNGICGFMTPMPGGTQLLRRDTLLPQQLEELDTSIFWENRRGLGEYAEILQCRQIELTIQNALLDQPLKHNSKSKANSKSWIDDINKWRFDPLENATHCPEPSRILPYDFTKQQEKYSLKIVEAEELSHSGTITWLTHILRDQLGIKDETLIEFIVMVIGDLGTVNAIHAAKRLRIEDSADLDKLQWILPLFGLFHLRKAYLELILKAFHQPKSTDFAHLQAIIQHKNFKGFSDGKCQIFKRAEDLILLTYRSYIVAWILNQFPHPNPKASPSERKDHATKILYQMGKQRVREEVVKPMYKSLFSHKARYSRNPASQRNGEGPEISQQDQAGQMLHAIGLYVELRETEKYGRVGKLPNIFKLLLPWFAGTSAHLYTRELVSMILLGKSTTPETYSTIIDSLLVRAKGKWFVAADTACEQEVRINKEVYKAKGGNFRFENLLKHTALIAGSLYDCKVAVSTGHLPPDKVRRRGNHYDVKMDRDILSVASLINHHKILDEADKPLQTIYHPNPYRTGWWNIQHFDFKKFKGYMSDMDFDGDRDEVIGDATGEFEMDNVGAIPDDPEIEREDDEEYEDSDKVLGNARLQLQEELARRVTA